MFVNEKMAREAAEELALAFIGLDAETVQFAYRAMSKVVHPDVGGTPEQFAAVDRAKHVLLAWLAKQAEAPPPVHKKRDCIFCEGRGHTFTTSRPGTKGLRRQCRRCHGSGDADYDAT